MNKAVKVIRFYKTGGSDVLKIEGIQISQLKANEVLVRVQAVTVSRPDLLWREGSYFEEPEFPAQIGYDAAGIVESIGPEVKTLKVGDRVSTFPAVSLLDYAAHGETIIYPETALIVYPESLTPVQAASVNTGLFTAYFALLELAYLKRDQHVVITAASSSMGVAAIPMARAIGAKSIAVTRSEAKKDALLGVGADQVIIASREDVQEAILELTEGRRGSDLRRCCRPRTRRACVGNKKIRPCHRLRKPWGNGIRDTAASWRMLPEGHQGIWQFPSF